MRNHECAQSDPTFTRYCGCWPTLTAQQAAVSERPVFVMHACRLYGLRTKMAELFCVRCGWIRTKDGNVDVPFEG